MRTRLITLIVALAAFVALPASAQSKLSLDAVTTTATGVNAGFTSNALFAHVFSAATSSATIVVEQSLDGVKYKVVAQVANPTSAGEIWAGPAAPHTRCRVIARASGTLSCLLSFGNQDELTKVWKRIDLGEAQVVPTATPTWTPTPTNTPTRTPTPTPTP